MIKYTITEKDYKRFFKKVLKSKKVNGCWWWDGHTGKSGYGLFSFGGNRICAHGFLLLEKVELEDLKGIQFCHKCDNPSCVNPDHIFIGTALSNALDKVNKGRQLRGEKHGVSKMTDKDVYDIKYTDKYKGMLLKEIAELFNVKYQNIYRIKNNKTWKHVVNG